MPSPNLLFWNRIEPHPRSTNIEDALKAEIRDPLWMLSRQWQLGEFQAENAGKATAIKLSYEKYLPQQIQGRDNQNTYFNGKNQPLESIIERTSYEPDLFTKIEIGRQWFRYLNRYLSQSRKEEIITAFRESDFLRFKAPKQFNRYQRYEQADILSNEAYINLLESLVKEEKLDGGLLIYLIAEKHIRLSEYILNEEIPLVDQIGERLLDWAKRIYHVNIGQNPYWSNQQLEHQFGLEIEGDAEHPHQLKAEEYFGDKLDWYQFNLMTPSHSNEANETDREPTFPKETLSKHFQYPSDVKYKGMPNPRWWELEDSTVNFGVIEADSVSPSTLLFTQFTLMYSNDWLMMPLELERGTLCKIKEMVVTDNFGIRTLVKHIHETFPNENWGLFQMHHQDFNLRHQNDTCLFVPSVIDDLQKSNTLEEINFLRDEMANMVWAVENKVPDLLGEGIAGEELAAQVQKYLSSIATTDNREDAPNQAKIKYQITTEVPSYWIPLVLNQIKNQSLPSRQIQLQRASMPRIVNGFKPSRIRPKTSLLSQGLKSKKRKPFYIHEDEIPRSGAIIKGRWKRVRWLNGQTIVWYSYEKTNGRGEGNSELKFDQGIKKK